MLAILSSWNSIQQRTREYYLLILLLQTGVLGVFLSKDLFLFYLFWEMMLVPAYFLIAIWGSERRFAAAMKFFIYTLAGSLLMLLGIVALYYNATKITGLETFDIPSLLATAQQFRTLRNRGFSGLSSARSPSKFRSSRSTPGCPMRTPKLPPP